MFATTRTTGVGDLLPYQASPLGFLTGTGIDSTLADRIRAYRTARQIALDAKLHNQFPPGAKNRLEAAEQAIRIAPLEVEARALYSNEVNEGAIHKLIAGDLAGAGLEFRKVLAEGTNEERAIALNNLGAIAFDRGDLDSAGVFWQEALHREPFYPTVITNLGLLATREGKPQEAVTWLRRALPLDPRNAELLNNLAFRLASLDQDLKEADSLARRAVALDPDPNYRDTLGYVLLKRQRWKEAEKTLDPLVKADDTAWEALLHLGMARAGLGATDAAREAFRSVIERSGDDRLIDQARTELGKL